MAESKKERHEAGEEAELHEHEHEDHEKWEHVHGRLERLEKHARLPKYVHEEHKKSHEERREEAQRKRHRG